MFKNFRFFVTARGVAGSPQWDLTPVNQTSKNCGTPNARMGRCNKWLTVEQALKSKGPNYTDSFLASFSAVCFLTVRLVSFVNYIIRVRKARKLTLKSSSIYFIPFIHQGHSPHPQRRNGRSSNGTDPISLGRHPH